MFRKFNSKTLFIVFAALLTLLLISKFFEQKQGERTFKSDLVDIDSATALSINSILIYPQAENHAELKLTNTGAGKWQIQKGDIQARADSNSVKNLLLNITRLKSQQLVSNDKNNWKDFSVNDSLGTRVKILDKENEPLADVVIGRFSFNQNTRKGSTYVRIYGEDEVYSVEGFLSMSINQKFDQWRIKTIVSGRHENWNKLTFQYPADTGFVLTKENNKWKADTAMCDSVKTGQYLSRLANLSNSNFIDDFDPAGKSPVYTLKIEGNDPASPITLKAYPDPVRIFILSSSMNPDSYFGWNSMIGDLFPARNSLTTLSN